MPPVRLAVPEKCCGLTLILAFFDRCRYYEFPSSAAGSGNSQFTVLGEGSPIPQCAHWGIPPEGEARAVEDASPYKNTEQRVDPSVTRRAVTRRATPPLAQGRLYGPPRASRRARNARRSKLCSAPTGIWVAGRVSPLSQPAGGHAG